MKQTTNKTFNFQLGLNLYAEFHLVTKAFNYCAELMQKQIFRQNYWSLINTQRLHYSSEFYALPQLGEKVRQQPDSKKM
jgi:hypothetical protein